MKNEFVTHRNNTPASLPEVTNDSTKKPEFNKSIKPIDPPGHSAKSLLVEELTEPSSKSIEGHRLEKEHRLNEIKLGKTSDFKSLKTGVVYIGKDRFSGGLEFLGVHTKTVTSKEKRQQQIDELKEKIATEAPPKPKLPKSRNRNTLPDLPSLAELQLGELQRTPADRSVDKHFRSDDKKTNHSVSESYGQYASYADLGGTGKHTSYIEVTNFGSYLDANGNRVDNEEIDDAEFSEAITQAVSLVAEQQKPKQTTVRKPQSFLPNI